MGDRTEGFAGSAVQPVFRLQSYNTVDLNFAVRAPDHVEVDIYARNIFDTHGEVSASTAANAYNPDLPVPVILSQPLTAGFVFKYQFGG